MRFHLAQVNVSRRVNAAADAAPGFVWRLRCDGGARVRRRRDDRQPLRLGEVLRRRREFFTRDAEATLALWWMEADTLPTVGDAEARLTLLRAIGPSPDAFTFTRSFPPPGGDAAPVDDDRELCPAP